MSRSLGLREDQQVREVLVMQIAGLFPLDPVRCHRGQALLPQVERVYVGANLLPQVERGLCGSKACPR
ncbi:hypothetical protein F7R20_25080 [Pseudomonas brassicacearum subsp. brassicacearum]|uniref:Uncharacterized protein n=1 Tax=Pseudomonas palleroniana TaxID=191390 RepID=A0A6H9RT50_9PSED|nr:hypothetical protein F7R20_25080 [Pseudomonas brassicacearum subsp. brassicacearum]KAB0535415.1 hypothetical protein F7R03_31970 [Pseudomonas palleroniana]KIR16534.1 hypothetical protein PFLU4_27000 [Pseudomonas fluorescens]QEO81345.1 hypothetical protein ELZ14_28800 [Pseudomonas brassicacearum]SDP93127.1 hypothetical protein SAMN04490180_4127 [Pseudomonas brassicacearum]